MRALYNVQNAYAFYDRRCGWSQGMPYIANWILKHTRTLKVVKNESYKKELDENGERNNIKGPYYIDFEYNEVDAFLIFVHIMKKKG